MENTVIMIILIDSLVFSSYFASIYKLLRGLCPIPWVHTLWTASQICCLRLSSTWKQNTVLVFQYTKRQVPITKLEIDRLMVASWGRHLVSVVKSQSNPTEWSLPISYKPIRMFLWCFFPFLVLPPELKEKTN